MEKPLPMNFFADWLADKSPPTYTPRQCAVQLTKLVMLKILSPKIKSVIVAVKILPHADPKVTDRLQKQMSKFIMSKGSKLILRSNEIPLLPNGLLDVDLELNFSILYSHMLKGEGSKLHVMLQRRKRYKKTKIVVCKTLAVGMISMAEILQKKTPNFFLRLFDESNEAEAKELVAKVFIKDLTIQPLKFETLPRSPAPGGQLDWALEEVDYNEEEVLSCEEGAFSDPNIERKTRMNLKERQKNLKERILSLLRRFRNAEGEKIISDAISKKLSRAKMGPIVSDDPFDDWENLSDSGDEDLAMSVYSVPRPCLKPFFSNHSFVID